MNQELHQEMQGYTDERIINNIKQKHFFSAESVVIAKEIALKRKLLSPEQIEHIDQIPAPPREPRDTSYARSKGGAGIGIGVGLFIVYIIVKMIIRFAMNN